MKIPHHKKLIGECCRSELINFHSFGGLVDRCFVAFLWLIALSSFVHADCQPDKDYRNSSTRITRGGVEVVDVLLGADSTVDSVMLAKIKTDMTGACFNDQQEVKNKVLNLVFAIYPSTRIDDLLVEATNEEVTPSPVQVRGDVLEEKCPTGPAASYQYLLDHRPNSLEANVRCVDGAFDAISGAARFRHSEFYVKALVNLLDFGRRDEQPEFTHHFVQYPATEYLHLPGAVPYLVDGIKQSDSELVQRNVAYVLRFLYGMCPQAATMLLEKQEGRPAVTSAERDRLQRTAEYISDFYGEPGPCRSENGEPSTASRELKARNGKWDWE